MPSLFSLPSFTAMTFTSGDLFCCEFHEFDFVGVFFDVVYGCGDACAVIEGDQALFL